MTIKLVIDGQAVQAVPGQTVMDAAEAAGIIIPSLCHHRDLVSVGSCRLCCVEVERRRGPVAACTLPAADGMIVRTQSPEILETRRRILTLLLRDYSDSGHAGADPETQFMYWIRYYNIPALPRGPRRHQVNSDPNPFVWVDLNKCIHCNRCVRACEEVQGRMVWGVANRGYDTRIVAGAGTTMMGARCESCGACAAYCPTGALDHKLSIGLGKPDRIVTTTCGYCGVGCGFDVHVKGNEILRVASNPAAPVNGMALCVKGRYGYGLVHHKDRLLKPRVRKYLLDGTPRPKDRGPWVETEWDTAIDVAARQLLAIRRASGADAIGVLASAKCTNEDNYLAQKFARQVIGTHNVDHGAGLSHAATVAGLAMCYGFGAMSNTMDDIAKNAKAIFLIGSNTTERHPVFGARIRQAVRKRGLKLVVADPRRIDITEFATVHLRHEPGTDATLVNGLMHLILKRGWHDQHYIEKRCEGFDDFKAAIERCTPAAVSATTGVAIEDIERAAKLLALNKPMAVVCSMGITRHATGVINVLSLGNLQMLLGNIGVPGGGVNPLGGRNNVQGACDMGGLPNAFPGYQSVADAEARKKFETAWKLDGAAGTRLFGETFGLTAAEMFGAMREGKIRALYIVGEDPLTSDPDPSHAHDCLERCDFAVVQDIFPSATSAYADVLLPAAFFLETDGTFTNTERHIQRVRTAIDPVGEARPGWDILSSVAKRILTTEGRRPTGAHAAWEYASPAAIMDEIAALTPSYAGVSFARLDRGEQLFWPVSGPDHPGTPILHVDRFAHGKGRFHAIDHLPAEERPQGEFGAVMTTGRYHWHRDSVTGRARGFREIYPESLVEISPQDAINIGLNGEGKIRVISRRGEMIARAVVTDRVSEGVVFGNFQFPGTYDIGKVTIAALDPAAKTAEYRVCAVKIEGAEI